MMDRYYTVRELTKVTGMPIGRIYRRMRTMERNQGYQFEKKHCKRYRNGHPVLQKVVYEDEIDLLFP